MGQVSTSQRFAAYALGLLVVVVVFATADRGDGASTEVATPLVGNVSSESEPAPTGRAPLPIGVRIERIGLDTQLVRLGLTDDGRLQVPTGEYYNYAGWYTQGAAPGERGPAVIAGHLDSDNAPSVFHRLPDVMPGDVVEVARADGSLLRFNVDRVDQFSKDAFPTLAVYGATSGPELRLITCGGRFDRASAGYEDNVVVFASLV